MVRSSCAYAYAYVVGVLTCLCECLCLCLCLCASENQPFNAVCFDVRDNADAGNSAKLEFEGSRALTKAINFQYVCVIRRP